MKNKTFLNKLDKMINEEKLQEAVKLVREFADENFDNNIIVDVSCKFVTGEFIEEEIEEDDLKLIGIPIDEIKDDKYYVWYKNENIMVVDELTQKLVSEQCNNLFIYL